MEDLDPDTLKKYRQLFSNVKPSHPWLALDDNGFLEKLGGYRKDRISKKGRLDFSGVVNVWKIRIDYRS